jgi:hypothetical protein
MDVFTHALVGAVTGSTWGHPVLGAVVAVLPDLPIWYGKRRATPPAAYKALHSYTLALAFGLLTYLLVGVAAGATVFACWLSHLALDIPTHGPTWAPRLVWPSDWHLPCKEEQEWEWLNRSWWIGFCYSLFWIGIFLWPQL